MHRLRRHDYLELFKITFKIKIVIASGNVGEGDCLGRGMREVFWGEGNVLYLDRSWGYTSVHLDFCISLYVHFTSKEKSDKQILNSR